MNCKHCNAMVSLKDNYCFNCGTKLKEEKQEEKVSHVLPYTGILFSILSIFIVGIFIFLTVTSHNNPTVYFNDTIFETKGTTDPSLFTYYSTSVIYDNQFNFKKISSVDEAKEYIIKDSEKQRKKCGNNLINDIENDIEKKYQIVAVNLCEFNTSYARNVEKVFDETFQNFPNTKGYMTNITLINPTEEDDFLASFKPVFQFVNSKGNVKMFPWVIKTQMLLNSNYYLNDEYLKETLDSSQGWFVDGADSYSIISHELGHYLSFVALLKKYNIDSLLLVTSDNLDSVMAVNQELETGSFSEELLNEAYENYIVKNGFISLNDFQGSISEYARNDIYDETIAEAYHDYYLHKDNAKPASLEIVNVLKERLK